MKFIIGQKVHFDTDNEEWGRVASNGTIIEVYHYEILVNAETIRADILVPYKDAVLVT